MDTPDPAEAALWGVADRLRFDIQAALDAQTLANPEGWRITDTRVFRRWTQVVELRLACTSHQTSEREQGDVGDFGVRGPEATEACFEHVAGRRREHASKAPAYPPLAAGGGEKCRLANDARTLCFILGPSDPAQPAFKRGRRFDVVYYSDDLAVADHGSLYARDKDAIERIARWLVAWDQAAAP
jgi:hypothetical protein